MRLERAKLPWRLGGRREPSRRSGDEARLPRRGAGPRRADAYNRVCSLAAGLALPSPWSLADLAESIGQSSGCCILLRGRDDLPPEISGISVRVGKDGGTLAVFYDARAPLRSQTMIVLHELAHHLLGHPPSRELVFGWEPRLQEKAGPDGPLTSRWCAARTSFADPLEVEAEMFATLVAERVDNLRRAESADPQLREIRRSMEPPRLWARP